MVTGCESPDGRLKQLNSHSGFDKNLNEATLTVFVDDQVYKAESLSWVQGMMVDGSLKLVKR